MKMQATGTVGEICSRDVVAVTRDTTVTEAAQLMRHHHIGTLVVCDHLSFGRRSPVGIVTDRDIVVEVVAPDLRPGTITVGDIMAGELVTIRESQGVMQALELMRHKGVRRLPVLDYDGLLSGLIAIDDILELLAEELTNVSRIIGRECGIEAANRR
jgi:CBS domain-containing protein